MEEEGEGEVKGEDEEGEVEEEEEEGGRRKKFGMAPRPYVSWGVRHQSSRENKRAGAQ